MTNEIRFVFEKGNPRIEELDWEGDVVNQMQADWGTIEGYYEVWESTGFKANTIAELDELVMQDSVMIELVGD